MFLPPHSHPLLLLLGQILKSKSYQFRAITPESHKHVLARQTTPGLNEQDVLFDLFGWSKSVKTEKIPNSVFALLHEARCLNKMDEHGLVKSKLRASTYHDLLFWHSAFPTTDKDAIFFGPDTYRFIRFLRNEAREAHHLIDIGAGSGAGAISLADRAETLEFVDVNSLALDFCKLNTAVNSPKTNSNTLFFTQSHLLDQVKPGADLLIANPPFISDDTAPTYANGGCDYGTDVALQIVDASTRYLRPGGKLLMYTGTCIVRGEDILLKSLNRTLKGKNFDLDYDEIDPDIFGEELARTNYKNVQRIAAVGLKLTAKPAFHEAK